MSSKICCTKECNKPATLQCPICIKHSLGKCSNFCGQDCFKSYWSVHKFYHPGVFEPWPTFDFTGTLRPWPRAPSNTIPASIKGPDYQFTGVPASEMDVRNGKASMIPIFSDPLDLEKARTVCRMARKVLDMAGKMVKIGATGSEIDNAVHAACIEMGAYPSPFNYNGFPKSCCISVNEVICHGIPDDRPFIDGDIVNIDITLYYQGFHGDLNETYFVGQVDDAGKKLVHTAREALDMAIAAVAPGVPYKQLGGIIETHVRAKGYSIVKNYCGHGIGTLFHGPPSVPHYTHNRATGIIREGHIFTIEPMVNEGGWRDCLWPDDWTAVTEDGSRSAQFEETLLVTATGCEILTKKT